MQRYRQGLRSGLAATTIGLLAACAQPRAPDPAVKSTTGTIVVRDAVVVETTHSLRQVGLRFDDGSTRTFTVAQDAKFQVGDPVRVTDTHGQIQITRRQ